ncbi:MAG: hypothetical protein K8S98_12245 [Planctomycetes bacterium]|nr:hypothetical protein [Planctomycetota bacterium]
MSPKKKSAAPKTALPPVKFEAKPPSADEMTAEVVEFITAIDTYKRQNARPFPNWSEILQVVKRLGYARR